MQLIEWLYQVDYKYDKPKNLDKRHTFKKRTLSILFASYLASKVQDWYDNLELENIKWNTLVVRFRDYDYIIPYNPKEQQFYLVIKLADLKQEIDK